MSIINYHNITYPDQNNGDGLRVVLWLSGCDHHCYNCQNPITWDANGGLLFDEKAKEELFRELDKDYISGLTLTGGDPLYYENLDDVLSLVCEVHKSFPNKTIWLYTGYSIDIFEVTNSDHTEIVTSPKTNTNYDLIRANIISKCNVVIDGQYVESQKDISLKWRGSKNQRCIDIKKSLKRGEVVLWTC